MKTILSSINSLKNSKTKNVIDSRINEFSKFKNKTCTDIFNELCFCLLTANYSAEGAIRIQKEIGTGFISLPKLKLAKELKSLGYRFPNKRAEYISEARKHKNKIKETICGFNNEFEARDWLVENVKGLGFKEASHFLRNIGYENLAIIDFHIIDVLVKHKLIEKPKTLTKKKYLEIEKLLEKIAKKANLKQGELDFYLWYLETGKILK